MTDAIYDGGTLLIAGIVMIILGIICLKMSGGEEGPKKFPCWILLVAGVLSIWISMTDMVQETGTLFLIGIILIIAFIICWRFSGERLVMIIRYQGNGKTSPPAGQYSFKKNKLVKVTKKGGNLKYWLINRSRSTEPILNIMMDKNYEVIAVFSGSGPTPEKPTLTIEYQGKGTTNPPAGQYPLEKGKGVRINAESGKLKHWLIDGSKHTGDVVNIVMNQDHHVIAVFEKDGPPTPKGVAQPVVRVNNKKISSGSGPTCRISRVPSTI